MKREQIISCCKVILDIFLLQNTYRLPLTKNILQLCPQLSLPLHIWPHFITYSHYNETNQVRQ